MQELLIIKDLIAKKLQSGPIPWVVATAERPALLMAAWRLSFRLLALPVPALTG
jgi:hypothetical protein